MTKQHLEHIKIYLRSDNGDVPGWVLVTLMSAGLVVLLWAIAGPALRTIFNNAVSKVVVI
jgi:hypothetical protein